MHCGPSYFAELTIGETSWASISSAARGFNGEWALAKHVRETSSHCSSSSGRRITGMRLRTGRTSSLGSVVMMVNDSIRFPSGYRLTRYWSQQIVISFSSDGGRNGGHSHLVPQLLSSIDLPRNAAADTFDTTWRLVVSCPRQVSRRSHPFKGTFGSVRNGH